MASPVQEINVECPSCGRIYTDRGRRGVTVGMAADRPCMHRPLHVTCPQCGTSTELDDLRPVEVWRDVGEVQVLTRRASRVSVRAPTYVPFDGLSCEQADLRAELRRSVAELVAEPDEVLHAVFEGRKPARSDVENLLLYNIGATHLKSASRYGLRFETAVDPARAGFRYVYELAERGDGFRYWRPGRVLARWDWTSVEIRSLQKTLEPVWLALRRAKVEVAHPQATGPFCVRLGVRPPVSETAAAAFLVKGFLDGTVCALQAHADHSTSAELARRVSTTLATSADEIEAFLLRKQRGARRAAQAAASAWCGRRVGSRR